MGVVVEQTIPFSNSQLNLDDPERWTRLFPLIRPSVITVRGAKSHAILVDKSLLNSKNVKIAAVVSSGNFSSKLLSEKGVIAFTAEKPRTREVTTQDIMEALKANGMDFTTGLVVVRASDERKMEVLGDEVVEVDVEGELELDHILSLLSVANAETKISIDNVTELLKIFLKAATKTTSAFDIVKAGGNPSVVHAGRSASFESAKLSIDKDLVHALRSHTVKEGSVIFAVHFSDINGLSRLETYLLAHGISAYLNEQSIASHITSSTILDHVQGPRGWAISLCPVPQRFLEVQAKPPNTLTQQESRNESPIKPWNMKPNIQLTDTEVRTRIVQGCERVIKHEPTITEYDTIVGDGDCGYTLRDGANQVLRFIANGDLAELPQSLGALVDDLEVNMGGTSGALYCIFLSALAQNLWEAPTFPDALVAAQDHLLKYTHARLGDRTCLDCLIPFVDTLKTTGNAWKALSKATKGVEGTKILEARLGRSTYLDESATRGVPDPGAYGLLKLLEGMVNV
ncbi:MAG: Dihydroxyacetone kinase 2 [Pycnora praestabilis]|nr:MAG: Dihydroxyacetone kinase 2 [Pycnora praestabilis]